MTRIFIAFLLIFLCIRLQAQSNQLVQRIRDSSFVSIAKQETKFMTDSLLLSSAQVESVDAENQRYFGRIAGMNTESLTPDQRKQKLADMSTNHLGSLKVIFTEAQFQQYQLLNENRQKRRTQ